MRRRRCISPQAAQAGRVNRRRRSGYRCSRSVRGLNFTSPEGRNVGVTTARAAVARSTLGGGRLLVDDDVRSAVKEYGAACAVEAALTSDVFRQELARHARDLEVALSAAVDAAETTL